MITSIPLNCHAVEVFNHFICYYLSGWRLYHLPPLQNDFSIKVFNVLAQKCCKVANYSTLLFTHIKGYPWSISTLNFIAFASASCSCAAEIFVSVSTFRSLLLVHSQVLSLQTSQKLFCQFIY